MKRKYLYTAIAVAVVLLAVLIVNPALGKATKKVCFPIGDYLPPAQQTVSLLKGDTLDQVALANDCESSESYEVEINFVQRLR